MNLDKLDKNNIRYNDSEYDLAPLDTSFNFLFDSSSPPHLTIESRDPWSNRGTGEYTLIKVVSGYSNTEKRGLEIFGESESNSSRIYTEIVSTEDDQWLTNAINEYASTLGGEVPSAMLERLHKRGLGNLIYLSGCWECRIHLPNSIFYYLCDYSDVSHICINITFPYWSNRSLSEPKYFVKPENGRSTVSAGPVTLMQIYKGDSSARSASPIDEKLSSIGENLESVSKHTLYITKGFIACEPFIKNYFSKKSTLLSVNIVNSVVLAIILWRLW